MLMKQIIVRPVVSNRNTDVIVLISNTGKVEIWKKNDRNLEEKKLGIDVTMWERKMFNITYVENVLNIMVNKLLLYSDFLC